MPSKAGPRVPPAESGPAIGGRCAKPLPRSSQLPHKGPLSLFGCWMALRKKIWRALSFSVRGRHAGYSILSMGKRVIVAASIYQDLAQHDSY